MNLKEKLLLIDFLRTNGCLTNYVNNRILTLEDIGIRDAIISVFHWSETPEEIDFWNEIDDRWRRFLKEDPVVTRVVIKGAREFHLLSHSDFKEENVGLLYDSLVFYFETSPVRAVINRSPDYSWFLQNSMGHDSELLESLNVSKEHLKELFPSDYATHPTSFGEGVQFPKMICAKHIYDILCLMYKHDSCAPLGSSTVTISSRSEKSLLESWLEAPQSQKNYLWMDRVADYPATPEESEEEEVSALPKITIKESKHINL